MKNKEPCQQKKHELQKKQLPKKALQKRSSPDITLQEILVWVLQNSANTEDMDKLSTTVFPYTSKYQNYYGGGNH